MTINIQKLDGHWTEGFALDYHTRSSVPKEYAKKFVDEKNLTTGEIETKLIEDKDRVLKWNTTYTEIGYETHHLKYKGEKHRVQTIASEVASFLNNKQDWKIDLIIPIPPSDTTRSFQPVYELAKAVGDFCNLDVDFHILKKIKETSQLKDMEVPEQRKEILKDAFDTIPNSLSGQNVLLFDDLFRSGETLNAANDILKNKGKAANIYVLTITKTRSKK
ncbi:MAG: ComF family protein [Bacteroidetes bacterium]|nr:ComF family protein [Bacteroidota bacterium]